MTALDLHLTVWGRALKPVHAGFMWLMTVLVVYNVTDAGALGSSWLGDAIAIVAASAAGCLAAGWAARSQAMAAAGLFLSGVVYTARAVFVGLMDGFWAQGLWLSLGAVIIAWGSWRLETVAGEG